MTPMTPYDLNCIFFFTKVFVANLTERYMFNKNNRNTLKAACETFLC